MYIGQKGTNKLLKFDHKVTMARQTCGSQGLQLTSYTNIINYLIDFNKIIHYSSRPLG